MKLIEKNILVGCKSFSDDCFKRAELSLSDYKYLRQIVCSLKRGGNRK
jgi:hypothetical protein